MKYISAAPGTRRLTFPCPFAEIAPLATIGRAVLITWLTRSLSMSSPHRGQAGRLVTPTGRPGRLLMHQS